MVVVDPVPVRPELGSQWQGIGPVIVATFVCSFVCSFQLSVMRATRSVLRRVPTVPMADTSRFPKLIAFDLECVPKSCAQPANFNKYAVILFGRCGSIPMLVVCGSVPTAQWLSRFLLLAKLLVL